MDELTNPETPDAILTLKEVAAYLKLAERTVYLYAQNGKIPGIKIGSAWRFRRVEIDAWLDEQRRVTRASTKRREGSTTLDPTSQ
jgi:excisionase family DNA binding protein